MPIHRDRLTSLLEAAADYRNAIIEIQRRANYALKNDSDLEAFVRGIALLDLSEFLEHSERTTKTLATELERIRATEARTQWRRIRAEKKEIEAQEQLEPPLSSTTEEEIGHE